MNLSTHWLSGVNTAQFLNELSSSRASSEEFFDADFGIAMGTTD
jgi:hypothetical protein